MASINKYFWVILFICFSGSTVIGQIGLSASNGGKSLAMGEAGVAFGGIDAIFNNQAGLVEVEKLAVMLNTEQRFGLSDLTTVSLGIAKKWNVGTFGLMVSSFGFESFRDQKIGIAYARNLTKGFSIGGQLDVIHTSIENFDSKTNFTFEVGIQSMIMDNLILAAHVFSPTEVNITENDAIPSVLRFGLRYEPNDKLEIYPEFYKVLDQEQEFKLGIQYQLLDQLAIRVGMSTNPSDFSAGFSYQILDSFYLEGSYNYHQVLGSTPGVTLKYIPK